MKEGTRGGRFAAIFISLMFILISWSNYQRVADFTGKFGAFIQFEMLGLAVLPGVLAVFCMALYVPFCLWHAIKTGEVHPSLDNEMVVMMLLCSIVALLLGMQTFSHVSSNPFLNLQ